MNKPLNKITIIGVGLIGGSFAKAAKELGLASEVMGYGRRAESLQWGLDHGVLDCYTLEMAEAVQGADLVFLAVPLGMMEPMLQQMQPYLADTTIVTDGGSAKTMFIEAAQRVFGECPSQFVPGHPIAGKEISGIEASDAQLYVDHRVILTPTSTTSKQALQTVEALWGAMGANVEQMSAQFHDEVFAATSHLPHLLAFGLVDMLHEHPELGNVFKYTAGGFRDFTRIASSDATMWRDIALYNHSAIAKWLKEYQAHIGEMAQLVEAQDGEALHQLFAQAKDARDTHILKK